MIAPSNRALAVELIQEANQNGARLAKACQELNISVRTYERWVGGGGVRVDQRPLTKREAPKNKLSPAERAEIITVVKQEEYADVPPTQIVPKLAIKESTLHQNQPFIDYYGKKKCKTIEVVAESQRIEFQKVI